MIVRESIILEGKKNKLALSAGLAVIQDNKILLAHPTGAKWYGTYSLPKGHIEAGEGILDAALRETREEIGIDTTNLEVEDPVPHKFIDYTDKKGKVYKRVYYFIARPTKDIEPEDFKLQWKEVDWAGFLSKEDAEKRIHWRFKEILDLIS